MANETPTRVLDQNSPVRWTIASLVRIVIPVLLTWGGLELTDNQTAELVASVTLVLWTGVSLWMSVSQRKKLRDGVPPSTPPSA